MSSDLLSFAAARKQSRASLLGTWLDGGTLEIYATPRPATSDDVPGAAALLAVFEFDDPAGSATDGVWSADPLPDPALVLVNGDAVWGRFIGATAGTIADAAAGIEGSGEAIELVAVSLVAGGTVAMSACSITEG